jgi:hypothetical protein
MANNTKNPTSLHEAAVILFAVAIMTAIFLKIIFF